MADFLHSLAARLRRWIGNRRHPARFRITLPCSVSVYDERGKRARGSALAGQTVDISGRGVAFVVPAIRIGHSYIAGENRTLRLVLELPTGEIESYAVAARYERLEDMGAGRGYVVGARITRMSEEHRNRLSEYLLSIRSAMGGQG